MSIIVVSGRGAEGGVLIRNAQALEILEKVTSIVVDKTGRLTEGKPKLVTIELQPGTDAATLLRLTASLEHVSEHPLAFAILGGARERHVDMSKITNFACFCLAGQAAFRAANPRFRTCTNLEVLA